MKTIIALLLWLAPIPMDAADSADGWRLALPGWNYQFPRDHGAHPDFKTEWWYFTGGLHAADGREFGYELTWFRQGVIPRPRSEVSRFVVGDFKFAPDYLLFNGAGDVIESGMLSVRFRRSPS